MYQYLTKCNLLVSFFKLGDVDIELAANFFLVGDDELSAKFGSEGVERSAIIIITTHL